MLHRQIPWIDPAEAMLAWADDPVVALLDSGGPADERGRYSYLGVEPFRVLVQDVGGVRVDGRLVQGSFLHHLAAELARWALPPGAAAMPFTGGAIGFLGYDLAREIGGKSCSPRHGAAGASDPPMACFGFYDVVFTFDRRDKRAWLCSSGLPAEIADRERRARARMDEVLGRLSRRTRPPMLPEPFRLDWRCVLTRADYEARVARIIEHIRAGDIYQANFTCRHVAPRPPDLSPAAFYHQLKERSPAPFGAFLGCAGLSLASVSPERFIRLGADRWIETRPIKGTRPRGATPAADRLERQALESSAKDHAENLMIVDLMRHDLGRVAEIGSVTVPTLAATESFASVHHLVSVVRARLKEGLGPIDVLRATLPGGSITGAPKIRAMDIIDAIEGTSRGAYCGVIGWIGFDGAMDTNIAIRTVSLLQDRLEAQAGGGIVADSDPADEYEEMLVKVRPLLVGRPA